MNCKPNIPGEYPFVFGYPNTWLIGAEIGIGQADYRLAFDPAEIKAQRTPLGYPYENRRSVGATPGAAGTSWCPRAKPRATCGPMRATGCRARSASAGSRRTSQ